MSSIKKKDDIDPKLADKWETEDQRDGEKWEQTDATKNPDFQVLASAEEAALIKRAVDSLRQQRGPGRPPSGEELKGIYLNLPLSLLARLKVRADNMHLGYQALIKTILAQYFEASPPSPDKKEKAS